ncbi:MAG TPA: EamA family transporter, partial [Blastocatellia bacterium]|nr:EamA family transporter [Blastocatellia bacterium]
NSIALSNKVFFMSIPAKKNRRFEADINEPSGNTRRVAPELKEVVRRLHPAEQKQRSNAMPVIVWIVLSCIWGSTWLFIKLGLEDLPPLSFAGIRFIIAVIVLGAIMAVRRSPLPRRASDWGLIALTGVVAFSINYGLLFWGEQYISSGLAALLQATIPLFGLAIAHRFLPAERMTVAKVAGVLLGLVGVGVIFSNQLAVGSGLAIWGSAAIVVGAFAVAFANVLIKSRGGHFDPAVLAAGQMFFGLIPLMAIGLIKEGNPLKFRWTTMAVVSLFYLALVGSSLAFMLYYWLVRHMAVTNTMLISLVTPVIAVLLGMVTIGEQLSWRIVTGGLCILAGIGMILLRRAVPSSKSRIQKPESRSSKWE